MCPPLIFEYALLLQYHLLTWRSSVVSSHGSTTVQGRLGGVQAILEALVFAPLALQVLLCVTLIRLATSCDLIVWPDRCLVKLYCVLSLYIMELCWVLSLYTISMLPCESLLCSVPVHYGALLCSVRGMLIQFVGQSVFSPPSDV